MRIEIVEVAPLEMKRVEFMKKANAGWAGDLFDRLDDPDSIGKAFSVTPSEAEGVGTQNVKKIVELYGKIFGNKVEVVEDRFTGRAYFTNHGEKVTVQHSKPSSSPEGRAIVESRVSAITDLVMDMIKDARFSGDFSPRFDANDIVERIRTECPDVLEGLARPTVCVAAVVRGMDGFTRVERNVYVYEQRGKTPIF